MSRLIDINAVIRMLNTLDRYISTELTLCDTDKTFPRNEVFVVDDVYEGLDELPSAEPERAIKDCRNCKHGNYNDHWDTYFCYHSGDCNDWDKWEPSVESAKIHTKAGYIMALHKEYGCTLARAEEAHNKALEYLRSKARMKG